MKKLSLCIVAMLIWTNTAKATFLEGMEDIPVMKGLTQVQTDSVSFGNEESRFVETHLTGKASFGRVTKFYKDTLPQMGWTYQGKRDGTLIFYRESEMMEIALEQKQPLLIRITIKNRD